MAHPAVESDRLWLNFDRCLKLMFHGSSAFSDVGMLAIGQMDALLDLIVIAGQALQLIDAP